MFLGPLELSKPWNTNGISGTSNFIRKLWRLFHKDYKFNVSDDEPTRKELKSLHKLIKKVTEDIERFSFNTSVSNFMICVNELTDLKCDKRAILQPLVIALSPYAPHVSEELWSLLGQKESITYASWPAHKEEFLSEDSFAYPISLNGKTKFNLEIALGLQQEEIQQQVMNSEEVQKLLQGKAPKKVIIVPGRIVNIVV
jgi:leucyl-tRNA synthetase